MEQKEILAEYNKKKNIFATAQALGVSTDAVRKTLIAYGVIETPLTRRIAEALGISTAHVCRNTPYDREPYLNPSTSKNAEKLRKWRKKKGEVKTEGNEG